MKEIDIKEKYIQNNYSGILEELLLDRTTKKNLIWGTKNYSRYGRGYRERDQMKIELIINQKNGLIKPRIKKSQLEQKRRKKNMAEVFTPSWLCNKQNNIIDEQWFGYKHAFNIESENGWVKTRNVKFKNKNWKDYIDLERLEITCGEAPYLTSRYDVVTGKYIDPLDRIGLLDRKLRVISENTYDENEWIEQAETAYKRIYGYDFQGDNVFIARENLLFTFIDFYYEKFNKNPQLELLLNIAKILSWNIWQMDGIKFVIPMSCHKEKDLQISLFKEYEKKLAECKGCRTGNNLLHNGIFCNIKDWRTNKIIRFIDLLK